MPLPRPFHLIALTLLIPACAGHRQPPPTAPTSGAGPTETISIRVSEGTTLAFDMGADGRVVFDLLGQIWEVGPGGGDARPLTNAVRDTAEDLDPSYAPDGRRVVFRGERRGRTGLWLLDARRAAPRQLTQLADPDGYDGNAAWSPDGKTIAFARLLLPDTAGGRARTAIALLGLAADSARLLRVEGLPAPDVRDPAWEPGGTRIAFVARNARAPRGGRVWVVDTGGGKAVPITPEGTQALAPAFAPDARRIAFFAPDSAGLVQVWVQDASAPAAAPVRITSQSDVTPTRVRWTADGRAVAYAADGRLWKVPSAGGAPSEIRFTAELSFERPRRNLPQAHFPEPGRAEPVLAFAGLALSPDARSIGMIALDKLWVMPVVGAPRAVADVPGTARYLAWSADGSTIAWSAGRAGEEDIFATDVAGGATHRVTALPGREVYPTYSRDGRHLAFVHGAPGRDAYLRVVDPRTRDLSDSSRTGILDSLDLNWTASDADVPVWTPQSDGLLRTSGGWSPPTPGTAVLVNLSGVQRRIVRFPDSPIYLRWTDGAIVFVRHARLWRARFDSTGMLAPPEPLGADPAMYVSAATDGTLLYVSEGGLRLRAPDGVERRLGWPLSFTPPVAKPLLIRNARVIDGTGAPATPPRDILIQQGRIARIAPTGAPDAGTGNAETRDVLDAAGGFVMPGLMDLHAHEYRPDLLPGFLYFGVTTMRDQGSPMAPLLEYAERIAAGMFEGPRIGYGGFQLYTDWAYDTDDGQGVEPEADPDHVVRTVALAALFGSQHVKTRTFRRWDINARLVSEAHRRGMRATGHCAHQLPLVAAGMDAQEHAGFCSPRGDSHFYDDLVQLFRAADIALVPTITYTAFAVRMQHPEILDQDPEVAPFLPARASFDWMVRMNPELRRQFTNYTGFARETALKLERAGVTIGTGTDIWQVPTGVHMEMEELVAAGFSPLEAIRAATANSARILGAGNDLGTVTVGKLADLVILDADPTADIRNTRRIRSVVQAGRVVDRKALRERFGKY